MFKSNAVRFFAVSLVLLAIGSVLLVACQRPGVSGVANGSSSSGSSGSSASAPSIPTVHMNDTNFVQSSVTIPKGSQLELVDDAAVIHIIMNGSWVNGAAQPKIEPGAPTVSQQFTGNDTHDVGPFNTAGTFHLYCTVHTGMNLTVIVQ
jgi:plastocyanin